MLFDGDLLLDMEMTIYEDLMVKCGGFSVTLSGSYCTPFTSVRGLVDGILTRAQFFTYYILIPFIPTNTFMYLG